MTSTGRSRVSSGKPSRRNRGPKAIIRCTEKIPCNPCEQACPQKAIRIGRLISNRPVLRAERCTGCGLCIASCPGLAIRVIDRTYSKESAAVKVPHEFLPIPTRGETVTVVDAWGASLGEARVINVMNPPPYDRTAVVEVEVPQAVADKVVGIAIATRGEG